MLDEIAVPRAVLPHIGHQFAHHVQLVIPWKNQSFVIFQAHELLQDVHHAVFLEHLFPEVGGGVAVRVWWVACAAVPTCPSRALVEGQKAGVFARKPGGHPYLGQVYAEIAEDALVELEAHLPRVAVVLPLLLGVLHGLPGVLILQLKGKHRNAVDGQHHIHRIVRGIGVKPLPVAGDLVLRVPLGIFLVQRGFRLKEAHPEPPPAMPEPMPQHRKQPIRIAGIVERRAELPLRAYRVLLGKERPLGGLGLLHKADERIHKQPLLRVVAVLVAGVAADRGEKRRRNVRFKLLLGGDEEHG